MLNKYFKNETGRSMVEILGVMAVIGVLSIGGIMGYRYAIDKMHANDVLKDVETAYVSVATYPNREAGVLTEYTDAVCGYPMWTELIVDEDFSADIVLVKNVPESVCNIILDMTESSQWVVSSVESDTNYLYPMTQCAENNAMVFSFDDVSDYSYACDKECPVGMMCNIDDECVCETGTELDEDGLCVPIKCDTAKGLEGQSERFCCENLGGYWNYDTEPPSCGCEEGYFFNGETCAPDNWCSYTFSVPNIVQAYESDCTYEFVVPEVVQAYESDCAYNFTVTDTNGTITTTMEPVNTKTCGSGQYCILNWSNEGCTGSVGTYAAGTTTTLYGRCAPYAEYYNICQNKTEGEVSMTPKKACGTGQYCILNWSNEGCSGAVGTYGANTKTTLYGRCAPYEEYYNICQNKAEGEVSMTPKKTCLAENTYCSIKWGNNSCSGVGTYGANTTRDLYGVCLPYDGTGDTTCPFKY